MLPSLIPHKTLIVSILILFTLIPLMTASAANTPIMVLDIIPGSTSSSPTNLTVYNGQL
ncbi:MAG: hypothetical protein JXB38_15470 [Anaerolineales bacterium]|nr:hypothetical protein [Anaerolineales bacterium]